MEKSVPNDILEEILFRLPVKNVLRFRCVSRAWSSLISSRHFSELHFTRCPKASSLKCTRIVFVRNNNVHSLLHDPMVDVSDGNCFHGYKTKFVGSCDGKLGNEQNIILWNPSTKEYFELPKMPSDFGGENLQSDDHCAFGFGKTRGGQYKVVSLHRKEKHGCDEVIVSIYCLRTGEWRKLKTSYNFGNWGYLLRTGAKNLDGKIHWFASCRSDWGIRSFDLEMEECGRIKMPTEFDPARNVFDQKLEVCEGCIYVFIGHNYHVDV